MIVFRAFLAIVFASVSAIAPPLVHAQLQRITGTVTDARVSRPIPGAVVTALDSAGERLGATVADREGRFVLGLARPVITVRVQRIGFLPRTITLGDRERAGESPVTVGLQPLPPTLEPMRVNGGCPSGGTAGQALALWEQAQTGFLAAVVARDAAPARVRLAVFDRETSNGLSMGSPMHVQTMDTVLAHIFPAARPASAFASMGYVETAGTSTVFYAPDADVLLDPSFRDSHCFAMTRGDGVHKDELGIAFQPAAGRDHVVDVKGTVWLDQSPLSLRELDFEYTGAWREAGASGDGELHFRTAPNGVVVIEEWRLRTDPIWRGGLATLGAAGKERGGALLSASWPDGTQLKSGLSAVSGRVTDGDTKKPLGNISVALATPGYVVSTEPDGTFNFNGVMPGRYALLAYDSSLAAYGAERFATADVKVDRGRPASARIILPSLPTVAKTACQAGRAEGLRYAQLKAGSAMLFVRIVETDSFARRSEPFFTFGGSLFQAKAVAAPDQYEIKDSKVYAASGATTDPRFVICGIGPGQLRIVVRDYGRQLTGGVEFAVPSPPKPIDTITVVVTRAKPVSGVPRPSPTASRPGGR